MNRFKNILLFLLLGAVLVLGTRLVREQKKAEQLQGRVRSLVAEENQLQDQQQQLQSSYRQLLEHQQYVRQDQITYVDERKYYRMNWKNYIHISASPFKTGIFGGIRDLSVMVNNQSDFLLDNVTVAVQGLRKGNSVIWTDLVQINEIPARSSRSVHVPDNHRGSGVSLEVKRVTSQQMNFCYSDDIKTSPGQPDPYGCVANPPQ